MTIYYIFNPLDREFRSRKIKNTQFSTSTVVKVCTVAWKWLKMKSSVIVCFVFEMEIVGHGVSFIIIIVIIIIIITIIIIIIIAFFFISESQMDPPEPPSFSSEHGK